MSIGNSREASRLTFELRRAQLLLDREGRIFATVPSRPAWLVKDVLTGVDKALDRFEENYNFAGEEEFRGMKRSVHFGNNFGGGRKVCAKSYVVFCDIQTH